MTIIIHKLTKLRDALRRKKDFESADAVREVLALLGMDVEAEDQKRRERLGSLKCCERDDTAIVDWLESQHTLHRAVEILYVVDGYQLTLTYDGERISNPIRAPTFREMFEKAMLGELLAIRRSPFYE